MYMNKIMALLWIITLITVFSNRAVCDYQCTMRSFEVSCSGMYTDQISQKMSVALNKADVISLNLTNGIMQTISETTFQDFVNLSSLYVTDCGVSKLKDNAFCHSLNLKELYLNNNTLKEFNVRSLPPGNGLTVLDLSYNLLNELSDFNVSHFPRLSVLNLASNFLSYLPVNLLRKLEENNQFFLVADNNPWNCADSNWSEYLTDKFANIFCNNNTFDYTPNIKTQTEIIKIFETTQEVNSLELLVSDLENESNVEDYTALVNNIKNESQLQCPKLNCAKCSFYYCLMWFLIGIWFGIILGNIAKIKNLLCTDPVSYSDQSTQYENSMTDKYMVSGFHLDFNKRKSSSNPVPQPANAKVKIKEKADVV